MIRLARISLAMPGKVFELQAALKEIAAIVREVADIDVVTFSSMGAQVGEFVNVSNFANFAEFEEKSGKLLSSPKYQAAIKKLDGLVVPGSPRDHFLRQI